MSFPFSLRRRNRRGLFSDEIVDKDEQDSFDDSRRMFDLIFGRFRFSINRFNRIYCNNGSQ